MASTNLIRLMAKEWRPDLPSVGSGYSVNVQNVLPQTEITYGPFPSFTNYATAALNARCQGAISLKDSDGDVHTFAGTVSKLYLMTVAGPTWDDVSIVAGYTTATEDIWSFTQFGDIVIAANFADPIQSYTIGSSTDFANLAAAAPKAKYVAVIKDWLFAANTYDASDGFVPWRVWWSAYNDPTSWPTPGSSAAAAAQSDFNDIVGEGNGIQGIIGNLGTADGAVFFEHGVWRINYSGPPTVFSFSIAEGVRGTPAPGSIAQLGALVYYLGEDGFYVFDGTSSLPIGAEKVDKTFFADLDPSYVYRVCAAIDPVNKNVLWAYPGAGNNQGNPNKIIAYNWVTKTWGNAVVDMEIIFQSLAFGYSLDGLDTISSSLDALPFSLDSAAYAGGAAVLAGFDLNHYLGYFNGTAMAPIVDTEEIQPFNGQRTFVRNVRPIVDGNVTPTVAIGTRLESETTVMFNAGTAMNSLGWCPQRTNGQYTRARITLPAASVFRHIQGVEIDADPAGQR